MRNQKGNVGIVFVIILVVAVSSILLSVKLPSKIPKKNHLKTSISQVKNNLMLLISDDDSWIETISNDPAMNCLNNSLSPTPDCIATTTGYSFKLRNPVGEILSDINNGRGFSISGESCTGYNPNIGHPTCVLAYDLKWTPICPASGACNNPRISIEAKLKFSPDKSLRDVILNTSKFDFTIIR